MKLKKHLSNEVGLSDLLNYAHLIDEGIMVHKDGAFLTAYQFRGPDLQSSTTGELDAFTATINRMITLFDDGWMIHVDVIRIPSINYPTMGDFPDSVSSFIDAERRTWYESLGQHFENLQVISFIWKWPMPVLKTTKHWFVDGLSKDTSHETLTDLLGLFKEKVERSINLLSPYFKTELLQDNDLLSFLNTCITGEISAITRPSVTSFVDVILGRRNLVGGYIPKIGNQHIYVLSILNFLNRETISGLLEDISHYPLIYRWSNRFIPLSQMTAEREIKRYQKHWNNKVKGFWGIVREAFVGRPTEKINLDALEMSQETTAALTANSNGSIRLGYWTSTLILIHQNQELLEEAATTLMRYIEQSGFACIREDVNAFDAWLGSIPGHGSANIRRIFVSSLNLGHLLPLHTTWTGRVYSSNASLLPQDSAPVFYAATTGKTPFRFHLDVEDVGHQVVLGPTGAGKSTYLGFLVAQFLRYPKAHIVIFDKDYSHHALSKSLGGHHYDIGNAETLSFSPLLHLSTDTEKLRAKQWVESCVELQGINLTPEIRTSIHTSVELLAKNSIAANRNLTVLQSLVQNDHVRQALRYYTLEGSLSILDSHESSLRDHYLQCFEMNWLLAQKPEIYLPILLHLFNEIETRLDMNHGQSPTIIILEEAWLYIEHEVFSKKIRDWLKTLRKKNTRVIFATQSLADLYDPAAKTLTPTTAAIMESCLTKIYLPNPQMETEIYELYLKMGLNVSQINIIKERAISKKNYYVVTPEGNRLIDLGLAEGNPSALAFIGLSKAKSKKLIEFQNRYQEQWVFYWLKDQGLELEAEKYLNFIGRAA